MDTSNTTQTPPRTLLSPARIACLQNILSRKDGSIGSGRFVKGNVEDSDRDAQLEARPEAVRKD